jgi:hypothetical protein
MQRNTITDLKFLIPGDRFYRLKDKTKKVYEYFDLMDTKRGYLKPCIFAREVLSSGKVEERNIRFTLNESVVFLRNANPVKS